MGKKTLKGLHFMVIAVVFLLLLWLCSVYNINQAEKKKIQAELVLQSYCDNILLNLQKNFNYTDELIFSMLTDKSASHFYAASERIMKQPASIFTGYIDGMNIAFIYPEKAMYKELEGKDISESNYAYTLARLTGKLTVEGPIDQYGQSVFLIISPIFEKNGEGTEVFVGEAVVGIDSATVMETFKLEELARRGYEYELWSVDPMDGGKNSIARSLEEADFSYSIETKFEMPTVWTLSIIPSDGWFSLKLIVTQLLLILCSISGLALFLYSYRQKKTLEEKIFSMDKHDSETGFIKINYLISGLTAIKKVEGENFSLFYLVLTNYEHMIRLCTAKEKAGLLQHIKECLLGYIKGWHVVSRVGESDYIIILRDKSNNKEIENIKKGLMIELIKKVTLDGKKVFLQAECMAYQAAEGALPDEDRILSIIRQYHSGCSGY